MPNYRPGDTVNLGHGVLIEYPLRQHALKSIDIHKKNPSIDINSEIKEAFVFRSIQSLLKSDAVFDKSTPLMELGLDSADLMQLRAVLNERLNVNLSPTFFFQYSTPVAIIDYLANLPSESDCSRASEASTASLLDEVPLDATLNTLSSPISKTTVISESSSDPIAVVGISCRFPGASTVSDYWKLLEQGRESIREVPAERWDVNRYYDPNVDVPGKMCTRQGGFLENPIDQFDAPFFNISPREAAKMDPQQRLLLETHWEALEYAGINPETLIKSKVGVFVGISSHDYELLQLQHGEEEDMYLATGNANAIAAGRIAYFFGFQGQAVALDTACSSSLVAVHTACHSLYQKECDLALASGVNLMLSPETSINFSKAGMLSPQSRCKTFDASADGYVRSEGCGVVVLKRLSDAQRDGDRVLAVIRGSAVNHDGASIGLTAPNTAAQKDLLKQALELAHLKPTDIQYAEAHGTGTPLGDPVEVEALQAVYGEGRDVDNPLMIGSVKTNIGHLEAAAGIAGLIKVVLALQNQYLPAHLHFKKPNPHLQSRSCAYRNCHARKAVD